ncbi:beta-lactamase family protein [Glycomyces sp. A-F 0318]|uniref:serine hydrolase domain-containing protein n=1 Tax=Glycomyces amatae TaxID=2881355 RepID=UPI001E449F1A|nr:serine hydrolase domain-containing protein [Glycomyces amatae]MCD0443672.1 beta-lactamase family protein [Glycomyces amatae]
MRKYLPGTVAATAIAMAAVFIAPAPRAAADPAACRELDGDTVRSAIGRTVEDQLERFSIPGAAVSLAAEGETVLAEGFGLAEVSGGRAFDGADTPFHIDSVSKVFTATAVMQLFERGELELDADVNRYLASFQIEDAYPGRPITLEHLLTHTSGFEDALIEPDADTGLGAHVESRRPERVRPPGGVHSYSDYGFDLAGHIVEAVSGMPYEQYVHINVLEPLGMSDTRFATGADEDLAVGYEASGDGLRPAERGRTSLAPSVGVVSTAADMATFMTAQLTGEAGGARILKSSTVDLMHSTRFRQTPHAPGLALPFAEEHRDGLRLLGHSGEGPGTHSMLILVPQCGIGLFATYNGDGTGSNPLFPGAYRARSDLKAALVAELASPPQSEEDDPAAPSAERFAGTYRWTKLDGDDPARLFALLSVPADLKVSAAPGGGLVTEGFSTDADGLGQRWDAAGADRFRLRGGSQYLTFDTDRDGRPVLAATSYGFYHFGFQRIGWYESLGLHLAVLGVGGLLILSALAWPVLAIGRRRRGRASDRWGAVTRLAVGGSAFAVLALAGAAGAAGAAGSGLGAGVLAAATAFAALGLAGSAGLVVRAWLRRGGRVRGAVHLTAVFAGAAAVFTVASYYDLTAIGHL